MDLFALQTLGMPKWMQEDDAVLGYRFTAVLNHSTPLRVLRWHGKIYPDKTKPPPIVARHMGEGRWMPTLGPAFASRHHLPPAMMASAFGAVPEDGGLLLKFFVAVREIIEDVDPIDLRVRRLRSLIRLEVWQPFIPGGAESLIDSYFPPFINTVELSRAAREALQGAGIDTAAKLDAVEDAQILAYYGMGKKRLQELRRGCRLAADQHATRVDRVNR